MSSDRSSLNANGAATPLWTRLWRYQAERFPLANHGILTLVFAAASCAFAAGLAGTAPSIAAIALAAIAGLCQFLLLRIADEHKDFATDSAHRPYRAVPRGLISLYELRVAGAIAAAIMLAAILVAHSNSLLFLAIATWAYFALMTLEFFAGDWLHRRPVVYLASHMVITPLIAWLLAGFQLARDGLPVTVLTTTAPAFFACAFFLGVVLELGRKIRSKADEETGVETYSGLWGAFGARNRLLAAAALALASMLLAIAQISGSLLVASLLGVAGSAALVALALRFRADVKGAGKKVETGASLFALSLLFALGIAPHVSFAP